MLEYTQNTVLQLKPFIFFSVLFYDEINLIIYELLVQMIKGKL